jgi:hypothetical protein
MNPGFEITFTDDRWIDEDITYREVRITLGDFSETMLADLTSWSPKEYREHWLFELNQLVTFRDKGCLITSVHDFKHAERVWIWPMWKKDDVIHFQNRLLFMLETCDDFDPYKVVDHVGEHQTESADPEKSAPSNWTIPATAVRDFLRNDQAFSRTNVSQPASS